MNLQEKTLIELKALAYDYLVQQELINNTLQAIYSEINKKSIKNDIAANTEGA